MVLILIIQPEGGYHEKHMVPSVWRVPDPGRHDGQRRIHLWRLPQGRGCWRLGERSSHCREEALNCARLLIALFPSMVNRPGLVNWCPWSGFFWGSDRFCLWCMHDLNACCGSNSWKCERQTTWSVHDQDKKVWFFKGFPDWFPLGGAVLVEYLNLITRIWWEQQW